MQKVQFIRVCTARCSTMNDDSGPADSGHWTVDTLLVATWPIARLSSEKMQISFPVYKGQWRLLFCFDETQLKQQQQNVDTQKIV